MPFKKYVLIFIAISSLLFGATALPLKQDYILNGSIYTKVIKIPKEYEDAAKMIDPLGGSVVSLPFSKITSINWSNYPKWKFVGHDVIHLLFKNNYISANTFDHPMFENKFSLDLRENPVKDPQEFISRLKIFAAGYIFIHKDVDAYWLEDSSRIYKIIVDNNLGDILMENEYFTFIKLREDFIAKVIHSEASNGDLNFTKKSPVQYFIHSPNKFSDIVFLQSYHPGWRLYPASGFAWWKAPFLKPMADKNHYVEYGYANAWNISTENVEKLKNSNGEITLVLYFLPQTYFYYGLIVSITTLISLLLYIAYNLIIGRKRKMLK